MGLAGEYIHITIAAAFVLLLLVAQELLTMISSTYSRNVFLTGHMSTLSKRRFGSCHHCMFDATTRQQWRCAEAAIMINAACKPMPGSHLQLFHAANQ